MKTARVLGTLAIVVATGAASLAQDSDGPSERGRQWFFDNGCHGCHTVGVVGTPIGPDLSHVGAKYPRAFLERWLRDPAAVHPAGHMPRLELTDAQISALAAFLATLR
jgi:mono/diheme cytochrome c family protein